MPPDVAIEPIKISGYDRYWIGRLCASFEQIVVDNLARK